MKWKIGQVAKKGKLENPKIFGKTEKLEKLGD